MDTHENLLRLHSTTPWLKLPVSMIYAFSESFELEASPVESQLPLQKDKKRRKWKSEKKIKRTKNSKNVDHFVVQNVHCPSKDDVNRGTCGTRGMLACRKCFF